MLIHELHAHHKPWHEGGGNGNNGNGNNVDAPEINGGSLGISIVLILCVWVLLKKTRSNVKDNNSN